MSIRQKLRCWAQNNPQFACSLAMMAVFAGLGAATGDFANLDGGFDTTGGTSSQSGP